MASVSLRDALDSIHSGSTAKARSDGIRDLKHILDYNRNSARISVLGDNEYHTIVDKLFETAVKEQENLLRGKTQTARTSASNKLTDVANALRHTVEAGARVLKRKTAQAVLDHVHGTITFGSNDEFCVPLALDYVKSMRAILEYPPHVASLHKGNDDKSRQWDRFATFCMDCIHKIEREHPSDAEPMSTAGTMNGFSVRSSRSVIRDPGGSQGSRTNFRPIAEELLACIRLLTAVPTVPLKRKASDLLWTIIEALQKSTVSHKAWLNAFAALNNIISWSRTEDINGTQKVVSHVVRLVRQLWRSNVTKEASCQMLVTLLLLEPYIFLNLQQPAGLTLQAELSGLLHVLRADYTKRKEREQLRLDDIRLEINPQTMTDGKVATSLLTLRCAGLQVESNWLIVHTMAFLHRALLPRAQQRTNHDQDSGHEDDGDIDQRPRKRQRTEDELSKLITEATTGTQQERTYALQILAFLAQQSVFVKDHFRSILESLAVSCGDEGGIICSWAFIAMACLAAQAGAKSEKLAGRFTSVWQLALRSLSNPSSCRAASYALYVQLKMRLISQQHINELQQIAHTLDLNGPSQMSDAASLLLSSILEMSQETSPTAGIRAAEAVAAWISHCFTPSRLEDKQHTANCASYDASDITSLICSCLGNAIHRLKPTGLPVWDEGARGWLLCEGDRKLVQYLLLMKDESITLNEALHKPSEITIASSRRSMRQSAETTLLGHLSSELSRTIETFNGLFRARQVTVDSFITLCKACVAFTCASKCISFRDTRRQEQLQKQTQELLDLVSDFVASPSADQDKADIFLSIFTSTFSGLSSNGQQLENCETSACQRVACDTIKRTLSRRENAHNIGGNDEFMDLDDTFDSQDSRSVRASPVQVVPWNDLDAAFSLSTLRFSSMLYATAVLAIQQDRSSIAPSNTASKTVVSFIVELPVDAVLSCRDVIASLPALGLVLTANDTARLLSFFLEDLIAKAAYKTSEVAIGTLLDIMFSIVGVWTDPHNKEAHNLGLDAYEWLITEALPGGFLSPNVVKRLMKLLVQLFKTDEMYGSDTDAPMLRSVMFGLLKTAPMPAQFELADRLPEVFGLYVLSRHEEVFNDLLTDLTENEDWTEGIALRLLFFSKLGSAWPSLLRRCVWCIFEGAGNIKDASAYATICINRLAFSLHLEQPRVLFSLFAPQLLWTWTDDNKHRLDELPFAVFGYSSVHELLRANESEVLAQATLRGDAQAMNTIERAVKMLTRDVVKRSYAKCLAYCMAYDVARPKQPGAKGNLAEEHLREIVGGKLENQTLITQHFPAIVGHFYLIMKTEDVGDTWLAKRDGYGAMAEVLEQIKAYSHSRRSLPETQEPNIKAHYLPDELERLHKRTQLRITDLWSPSSFALTARMLVSEINDSLGSLHTCLMIRRLRLFIAMSGELATDGFGVEMLIHSLRPFVSDSECADDTMGILYYLFNKSRSYLRSCLSFATGAIILLILQMRQHSRSAHDRTTQESQHTATIQKMISFQKWLVDCLTSLTREQPNSAYKPLSMSLLGLQLPGRASAGSPEASLLIFLLDQWRASEPLCSRQDIIEALSLLSESFILPDSLSEDCLGTDEAAADYCQPLWEILTSSTLSDYFVAWAASVVGRAYACTGVRPTEAKVTDPFVLKELPEDTVGLTTSSSLTLIRHVCKNLYSRSRFEAGLAEFTLRMIQQSFASAGESAEAVEFSQMLPDAIYAAICEGTFGWKPTTLAADADLATEQEKLRQALEAPLHVSVNDWATKLATAICAWPSSNAIVSSLGPLVQNINGLALQLLPSMIHMCLCNEMDNAPMLRPLLSDAISASMAEMGEEHQPRQKFFLDLVLYLRRQELPGETTQADRLNWLEVDYVLAAGAASRCRMPSCALLLAESAAPVAVFQPSRRSSSRASTSQLQAPPIPEQLQLAIYQQIEEPDSFYGVSQPASLHSVLDRLNHEQDGFRSLMFRSAQMDSHMRQLHRLPESDAIGMVQSLSALSFNSLAFAMVTQGMGDLASCSAPLLNAAQSLQQWDITVPDTRGGSSLAFEIHQELSRASDLHLMRDKSRNAMLQHIQGRRLGGESATPPHSWYSALSTLAEVGEVISCNSEAEMLSRWNVMQDRLAWMKMARFEEVKPFLSSRQTLFGVLGQNNAMQRGLHLTPKQCQAFEVEALMANSALSREHSRLQDALTATTTLSDMVERCSAINLKISGAAKLETATVLSEAGETTISVKMLRDVFDMRDLEEQDLQVGRAGLLAQIGHELSEARLEKPEDILNQYLKPAIDHLRASQDQTDAGKVYHELATFCDKELQDPGNTENLSRIIKLRQAKQDEVEAYEQAMKAAKRNGGDRNQLNRSLVQARTWLSIDRSEEQRLRRNRQELVGTSLQNYLRTLAVSEDHNLSVLRFFAMWLENTDDTEADKVVANYLDRVPSWKFVRLMNQLMTKLEDGVSSFQRSLGALMRRIFKEHPYHSLNHLFAANQKLTGPSIDQAAQSRYSIARGIYQDLISPQNKDQKALVECIFHANQRYKRLADKTPENSQQGAKIPVKNLAEAQGIVQSSTIRSLPPITLTIPLKPSGNYDDVPKVAKFDDTVSIMGGLSAPKMLKLWDTAGNTYRQLFKSGRDDLRQDAIMEQVFEEVSNMLRNHKATRQRDLKVRTYKVINLAKTSGVIEFVPNSIPFNDWLRPAHKKYYPSDYNDGQARNAIITAFAEGQGSQSDRVKAYQKVCTRMHPVMRHFFFERFTDPDEWFHKRTAYTRTTASVSILGHIIGLGDRHCSNILLDEKTGEVVHIDLGVAFEAGRVLTIPELIPFRLTRDVVDGMGVTKTEGVFRRCCEFTLDAVREDKESIMTLLNVLRYDPLVEWSVSPLRAKRMQEESNARNNGLLGEENSSKKREHSAGEADRALAIVEKKLGKTMSTTATVNELIQQATDEKNLACLFHGWAAFF